MSAESSSSTSTTTTSSSSTTTSSTAPSTTSTTAAAASTTSTDAKEAVKTSRTYVSNLAFSTGWQELKDFFRDNLKDVEIGRVELLTTGTGRSKGCAIVEFDNVSDAQRAINELSGKELGGRTIYIREDREDKGFAGAEWKAAGADRVQSRSGRGGAPRGRGRGGYSAPSYSRGGYQGERPHVEREQTGGGDGTQVYVGNLPWRTAWQDLKDMFSQYGDVLRADVAEDRVTRRSKGFGTVKFANAEDAQAAIRALNDTELNGRQLIVRLDNYA